MMRKSVFVTLASCALLLAVAVSSPVQAGKEGEDKKKISKKDEKKRQEKEKQEKAASDAAEDARGKMQNAEHEHAVAHFRFGTARDNLGRAQNDANYYQNQVITLANQKADPAVLKQAFADAQGAKADLLDAQTRFAAARKEAIDKFNALHDARTTLERADADLKSLLGIRTNRESEMRYANQSETGRASSSSTASTSSTAAAAAPVPANNLARATASTGAAAAAEARRRQEAQQQGSAQNPPGQPAANYDDISDVKGQHNYDQWGDPL